MGINEPPETPKRSKPKDRYFKYIQIPIQKNNDFKQVIKTQAETIDLLSEVGIRDALTGAYNRGFLDRKIEELTSEGIPYTAIMLDIDKFKDKNDTYGHPAGDSILKEFAVILDEFIRQTNGDIVTRYGGEEFMILIPHLTDRNSARQRADEIRTKIEESRFRIPDKMELSITTSIGVGVWEGKSSKIDFIGKVDEALYEAKRTGRNRVVMSKFT